MATKVINVHTTTLTMESRKKPFKSSKSKEDSYFLDPNCNVTTTSYGYDDSVDNIDNTEIETKSNILLKNETETKKTSLSWFQFETPLIWYNIIFIVLYHIWALYSFLSFPYFRKKSIYTLLWGFFMGGVAGFGVTGGAHRLWSHRAYKAKLPLRIILMICYSAAGQNRLFDWVRDHRVHHKFTETDADPHNSNRGFFFAHVGWLMMRKHPEVIRRGQQLDMSDILADPVVQFSEKYFLPLKLLFCFIIPSLVPVLFWDESLYYGIMSQAFARYILSLNFTWFVNSAAHIWGNRPYDNRINPSENLGVAIVAMGEGWHNYHHVFPWDYKAAELGNYKVNLTTFWIDLFAKIGWAYDLKTPSKDLVQRVVQKSGDGTHPVWGEVHEEEDNEAWKGK